ncbi:gas vesicle protein [Bacillus oleivorans]|uniref:Gas vesicle protein n=1 Tax=Bacillus oleivorans TaxID=1448271 RepID=A0A285CSS9_9BACI|nr:YtxH domain-containing protein [Bacillus oleivorans]SNX70013.1 gas vesicle protein [Bacillus oleivorans]
MKLKSLITGAIVGGILGGVTVLFTTPSSGKAIRSSIKTETKEWGNLLRNIQEKALDVRTDVLKLVSESKKAANVVQTQLKPSIEKWRHSIDPELDHFRREIEEIQQQYKRLERSVYQK